MNQKNGGTRVLLCTEPKSKSLFLNACLYAFDNPDILCISEYRKETDIWIGTFFYRKEYGRANSDFEQEWPDIHPRCTVLRYNDENVSHERALRMWNGIEELFRNNQFEYVIMPTIDRCLYDIIDRMARKNHTRVIGLVSSIFSGYCRMTVRGEYTVVRSEVPEEEIEERVHQLTRKEFLSVSETERIKRKHYDIIKYYYRRKLTESIYYPVMRVLSRDPWNHHYNITIRKGKSLSEYYCKHIDDIFVRIKDVHVDPQNTVYMPLHFTPEATMSYQCVDTKWCNYESYILSLIEKIDSSITIILKEHPTMYGMRELSFYKQVKEYPNVILVHPQENSNVLLDLVDTVATENSTVGVEALIRGKRVLIQDPCCYYLFHPNAFLIENITRDSLRLELTEFSNTEFVRKLSQSLFESDYICDTTMMSKCSSELLGKGIRMYIDCNSMDSHNSISQ